jgi:bifunctional enzyme CysN/CysC
MAINVTLADEIDVSRGDMLVHPENQPHVSAQVEAMVVWMHEKPLVPGRGYWIKHTTRIVGGELAELRYAVDVNTLEQRPAAQLAMNEVGHVRLSLNQPIAYDAYQRNAATGAVIVVDRITNNTVGAGMILEPGDRRGTGDHWGQEPSSRRLKLRQSEISAAERGERFGQKPVTILLTGLTGSGKATIAYALERRLFEAGRAVSVLYGQNMRAGLSRDLGFTADDRSENLRRSAEVAKIVNDAGLICICAFGAPHEAVREKAREVIGADRFLEVYLNAPAQACRARDTSGAYELADRGTLPQFPGVSAAFEPPTRPDVVLPTHEIAVEESVERILRLLRERGFVM